VGFPTLALDARTTLFLEPVFQGAGEEEQVVVATGVGVQPRQ
jgi:hypothetical protein